MMSRQWQRPMVTVPLASGDAMQPLWRQDPQWADAMQRLLPRSLADGPRRGGSKVQRLPVGAASSSLRMTRGPGRSAMV